MSAKKASTFEFRKLLPEDAPVVSERLAETFPSLSREQWNDLLEHRWPWRLPDLGTIALKGDEIVGYAGVLESSRVVGGKEVRYCTFSSWWIDPSVRSGGVALRMARHAFGARNDSVCTLLTLPVGLRGFWTRQGFVPFETERRVYPWVMLTPALGSRGLRKLPVGEFPEGLGPEARRILSDHFPLRCRTAVFEADGAFCGVVTRRRMVELPERGLVRYTSKLRVKTPGTGWRLHVGRARDLLGGRVPCAEVFYVSDRAFFKRHFRAIARRLCRDQGAVALLGDARRLGMDPKHGIPVPTEYFVRAPKGVPNDEVDALYSEFFVLPLGHDSR